MMDGLLIYAKSQLEFIKQYFFNNKNKVFLATGIILKPLFWPDTSLLGDLLSDLLGQLFALVIKHLLTLFLRDFFAFLFLK